MKKSTLLFCVVIVLPLLSIAQSFSGSGYVFEDFVNGRVLMKNGSVETAPLNYDANNQSIVFKKDAQVMVLTGLEAIDTIFIAEKKFIPVENTIYEVVSSNSVSLLSTYTTKNKPLTATTDHTGSSKQSSNQVSNTVSETYLNRRFQPAYAVEVNKTFWLKKGDRVYKASNGKQFINAFADKSKAIDQFIKDNKISFDNPDDLVKLLAYSNSL